MDKSHIKPFENGKKDAGIKIVKRQKTVEQGIGLFATQDWTGIGKDIHRAIHA